ncbi:MAG: elongation factor P maturation arginine rhamnosyltransferase EarP [Alphaproteobacteria bacterium]|nr:elongation factor P maturation arginine rhamnosyltransferase EarP [Alphaproteobacteria bacterium]
MSESFIKIDIFCHVVDNLGDIGVCWRFCRALVRDQGCYVRLFVDDFDAFAKIEPMLDKTRDIQHIEGVEVFRWDHAVIDLHYNASADAVIEAFACDLPEKVVGLMTLAPRPPVWLDLEYMSAEPWIDTHHAVVSPHPTLPLTKTLFFPGFTEKSGGLTREAGLIERRQAFQADMAAQNAWRASVGLPSRVTGVIDISLFCYAVSPVEALLQAFVGTGETVRFMVPAGVATAPLTRFLGQKPEPGTVVRHGNIIFHNITFLTQDDYDRLLWSCDLNFVRGEDSLVRAVWAGNPLVWDIYKQDQAAHMPKLKAFQDHFWGGLAPVDREILDFFSVMWNEGGRQDENIPAAGLLECLPRLQDYARRRSLEQAAQDDLATRLVGFILREMKKQG